jgi:hypothetical protein
MAKKSESFEKGKEPSLSFREGRKSKGVQVCPQCGSPNLKASSMRAGSTSAITGLGTPPIYLCISCGYEGPIIVIDRDKIGMFQEDIKSGKLKEVEEEEMGKVAVEKTIIKPLFAKEFVSEIRIFIILAIIAWILTPILLLFFAVDKGMAIGLLWAMGILSIVQLGIGIHLVYRGAFKKRR